MIITKKILATSCRKFISRYLINPKEDYYLNNDISLALNLTRNELWPKEILLDKEILIKDISLLEKANLTVEHCYELYNLLGGDAVDELKDIKGQKNKKI